MRNNYSRHLANLFRTERTGKLQNVALKSLAVSEEAGPKVKIPEEFNAKDWLSYLIHVDAELEHGLMIQYLYAAYSIGGDHIKEKDKDKVRQWQEIILGIAKEEMGHFVSVQNVLRVLGAPLNFRRQDFPWDSELYPFEFSLEPFTLSSLAKYVYAESPENWLNDTEGDDEEMKDIKKEISAVLSRQEHGDPISVLFKEILTILKDPELISDDVFLPDTYPYQAKFNEWGRGYAGGARGNTTKGNVKGSPDVLVAPLTSRTDTIAALEEIAEQGEATSDDGDENSHFERFLGIFKELRNMPKSFSPSRNVAFNPAIGDEVDDSSYSPSEGLSSDVQIDVIENPVAQKWAHLFNIRYRMLLMYLTHSFLLDDGLNTDVDSPRGTIIHATFGEMYNLRSIATVLVRLPLKEGSDKMAAPPFLTPYTMDLPTGESSRWRVHQDLIQASETLIDVLLQYPDANTHTYLHSLREADGKLNDIAKKLTGQNN